MNIKIDAKFEKYTHHINYTFKQIFSFLSLEQGIVDSVDFIYGDSDYSSQGKPTIQIKPSSFFNDKDYLKPSSIEKLKVEFVDLNNFFDKLPVKFSSKIPILLFDTDSLSSNFIIKHENYFIIQEDIIAASFFFLTRYEELFIKNKDIHDRVLAKDILSYKYNFLNRPVVNEYSQLILELIKKLKPDYKDIRSKFQVMITHDIDQIIMNDNLVIMLKAGLSLFFKKFKFLKAFHFLFRGIFSKLYIKADPYYIYEDLMDISEKYNVKSNFYFIPEENKKERRYNIFDSKVIKIFDLIKSRKHHIGIHTSYHAYGNSSMIGREKDDLEKASGVKVLGGRQHYLRWNISNSWSNYDKAKLQYDCTLGFAEYPGFRAGTCSPFNAFDLIEGKELDLIEYPLTLMDVSIYNTSTYAKLNGYSITDDVDDVWNYTERLFEECKKHHGVIVLLWHNSSHYRIGREEYLKILSTAFSE